MEPVRINLMGTFQISSGDVTLTPVYNFINGRLAAESAVLKPLL